MCVMKSVNRRLSECVPACLFVRADCVHKDMRLLMLEIWPGDISQACSDRCVPALVCKCARARCMHTHVPAGLGAPDLASRLAIFPQARSWRCLPFFVSVCVCVCQRTPRAMPAHSPSNSMRMFLRPRVQHRTACAASLTLRSYFSVLKACISLCLALAPPIKEDG